jgi:hypothetical protein
MQNIQENTNRSQDVSQTISIGELSSKIQELETQLKMAQMENQILQLKGMLAQTTEKKSGRGGYRTARPVLDNKTGKVYHAESAAGMAVCSEYKEVKVNGKMEVVPLVDQRQGTPLSATMANGKRNSFVWYRIPDRATRFNHITMEEYQKKSQPSAQNTTNEAGKVDKEPQNNNQKK